MEQNEPQKYNLQTGDHHSTNPMLRWAVNVNLWNPSAAEFDSLLRKLPNHEQKCCLNFKFPIDRKRALVSRLLQRSAASLVLRIPFSQVDIRKTKGNKPYVFNGPAPNPSAPNFNFNVAHEGNYAVLVSEPLCLCGVDISAPREHRHGVETELNWSLVERVCTDHEVWVVVLLSCMIVAKVSNIKRASDLEIEALFQRHWALKEAFVKARGDGLAFGLRNAEFCFGNNAWNSEPQLKIHGKHQDRWCFHIHQFQDSHWVAVAKGPPDSCQDEYGSLRSTFQKLDMTKEELQNEFANEEPDFEEKTVPELISLTDF